MKAVAAAKALLRLYPKDVKLVFKQYPLDSHADAEFGAEVALAAQAQGKFWEMHDLLYAGFPDLSRRRVFGYAKQIGLDMNRFTADVDSHKFATRVHTEEKEGENLGVAGTPTFFLDGRKYNGVFDVASVAPLIKKELTK
jgi:protein-disulfide isomerase